MVLTPLRTIKVEGFRAIHNEVLFLDMEPDDGEYEPLLGYIVLAQCGAAVDMIGHRLLPVKYMDAKSLPNKIICRFPHDPGKVQEKTRDQEIATLYQEIADAGGLGIGDPEKWQQEVRKDRSLPFREA